MTDQQDLDRLLGAFFAEGPEELADRVIDAALDQIDHTRQRRAPWMPLSFPRMNIFMRVAAAALVGVLAVGGTIYLIRPGQPAVVGGPRVVSSPGERGLQTATLLADGRVLVAGGYATGQVALASAAIYDPRTDTFSPTGSLTTARAQQTATLLADGRVLMAGGSDGSTSLRSAELYDPKTGTFTATGSMAEARAFHRATLLADGRVLVTGGDGADGPLATAEIYDPKTGKFSPTGSMADASSLHTATRLADGRVLIAGGGDQTSGLCFNSAEIYDPKTGTFSRTGALTTTRCGHAATLLADGKVLVTAGTSNWEGSGFQSSAEIYDPTTGKFTQTSSMAVAPGMATATLLADGRVLVAGGNQVLDQSLASAEIYDPQTGTFRATGSMATARTFHTATRLSDGRVLVAGGDSDGWNTAGPFLPSAEIYDPSTGRFSPAG
jgi:hypothetical protein